MIFGWDGETSTQEVSKIEANRPLVPPSIDTPPIVEIYSDDDFDEYENGFWWDKVVICLCLLLCWVIGFHIGINF